MKLLLDTHTFLWFIGGSLNLSDTARALIEDRGNQRFLSALQVFGKCLSRSVSVSWNLI